MKKVEACNLPNSTRPIDNRDEMLTRPRPKNTTIGACAHGSVVGSIKGATVQKSEKTVQLKYKLEG